MYLRNAWYVAATTDELGATQLLARTLLHEPIVFFRDTKSGKVAALEDRRCHRAAPLWLGEVLDEGVPRRSHGVMHVKANYVLFLENLMDLMHLPFVHKTSISGRAPDHAGAKMKVSDTPAGVRFARLTLGAVPPPGYTKRYGFTGEIDRWEEFEYVAPASVLQFTGAVTAGDYAKGIRSGHHHLCATHTFAPETERSCFYFYSFIDGYHGEGATQNTAMAEPAVLREDANLIEQQQIRLDGYDMRKLTAIPSDVARIHMARFLERKIAEEQEERTVPAE